MKNVAIIGGGILGLAIGYKLSLKVGDFKVTVFEKETEVGCHQSGRNSGVLHCGLNYKQNSLKAQLAVEGIREMILICKQYEFKIEALDTGDQYKIDFIYAEALYELTSMEVFRDYYASIIHNVLQNEGIKLSEIDLTPVQTLS